MLGMNKRQITVVYELCVTKKERMKKIEIFTFGFLNFEKA